MALKAVHVSDVPNLDQVPENASFYSPRTLSKPKGIEEYGRNAMSVKGSGNNFMVIGHRGNGMNMLQSPDPRMKAIKENTIRSFNSAANFPLDFIEFDVQVTKDSCPIIFHDNFIFSTEQDSTNGTRVTDLTLSEFLSYGPQREAGVVGKTLLRKTKEGQILKWDVESDDYFCTLQEAFQNVKPGLGFNIELKFDDLVVYQQEYLVHVLQSILQVVFDHAKERPIIFSSFQPDAILLIKKLQSTYPVFFLTNGGNEIYHDVRRNSLEEAIKVCSEGGLDGIVSEVRGIFRNPGAVSKIKKEMKKSLLTYGKLNNVAEAVYMQHLMGVDGVIVDLVGEITEAVGKMVKKPTSYTEDDDDCEDSEILFEGGEEQIQVQRSGNSKPQFSQRELAFLLKLIPELIQHQ